MNSTDRNRAIFDLKHWGYVARKRWQAEPKFVHPIVRMMELGIVTGPTRYEYEYEPDTEFSRINLIVMQLPAKDRAILVAHYIDRKPWRKLCRMMGLEKWWHVGKEVRAAEEKYIQICVTT